MKLTRLDKETINVFEKQKELAQAIINLSRLKGEHKKISEMKQVIRTCDEQINLLKRS